MAKVQAQLVKPDYPNDAADEPTSLAVQTLRIRRNSRSVSILNASRSRYLQYWKRPVDVVVACVLLVALIPVLVVLALLVRWKLGPGGVIFRQQRVGKDGVAFTIYKFRSMLPDRRELSTAFVGTDRRICHKRADDPRHTPFGRWLRSTSLDELPQLVNVIKGDMSMIGPRPELVEVARQDGFLNHPRHQVRPGISGPFQISPLRHRECIAEGLHLDVAYVANVTAATDFRIAARTLLVLAGGND